MKVSWTRHAEVRQKEWQKKLGLTREEVENSVMNPEQVVPGDMDVLVAQTRTRDGLLRAPFIETDVNRKILTVYWTSKIEKYWKGDKNED